ncbi:hypothetical protein CCH79_00012058 [Gambusia affinis]|uniref:Uncharacterized protein n=1 Tax=Gambusia affinis TaxID=33528 RepID=A0A315W9A0_GAMAF|nr:hypothetical protein CCH79_00012058 [Gambusia affinis]
MASASSSAQAAFGLGRKKKNPGLLDQIGKFFGGDKKRKGKFLKKKKKVEIKQKDATLCGLLARSALPVLLPDMMDWLARTCWLRPPLWAGRSAAPSGGYIPLAEIFSDHTPSSRHGPGLRLTVGQH